MAGLHDQHAARARQIEPSPPVADEETLGSGRPLEVCAPSWPEIEELASKHLVVIHEAWF